MKGEQKVKAIFLDVNSDRVHRVNSHECFDMSRASIDIQNFLKECFKFLPSSYACSNLEYSKLVYSSIHKGAYVVAFNNFTELSVKPNGNMYTIAVVPLDSDCESKLGDNFCISTNEWLGDIANRFSVQLRSYTKTLQF